MLTKKSFSYRKFQKKCKKIKSQDRKNIIFPNIYTNCALFVVVQDLPLIRYFMIYFSSKKYAFVLQYKSALGIVHRSWILDWMFHRIWNSYEIWGRERVCRTSYLPDVKNYILCENLISSHNFKMRKIFNLL